MTRSEKGIQIGLFLHSLAMPMDRALDWALQHEFSRVQLWNVGDDHDPSRLTPTRIRELRDKLDRAGAAISSLCGHMSFCDPATVERNVLKMFTIIDLAVQLEVPIVTTESGIRPVNVEYERAWETLVGAFQLICSYAAPRGVTVAIEAGSKTLVNSPELLLRLISQVNSPALKINIDPANLYKAGHDPVAAVYALKDFVVHAHAKDATRVDGEFIEPRLGDGDVPVQEFVEALVAIGFEGTLAIEREAGESRAEDVLHARRLLTETLRALQGKRQA